MPRKSNLPPNRPGHGRPKGALNKATRDIKEMATKLLTDEAYVEALKVRLRRGTAGAVETTLYHYAYGKPKETVAVEGLEALRLIVDK